LATAVKKEDMRDMNALQSIRQALYYDRVMPTSRRIPCAADNFSSLTGLGTLTGEKKSSPKLVHYFV
jgi:hypothetical protein